jgi:hypothetical protein
MARWHMGFICDLYWLRIQRDKRNGIWNGCMEEYRELTGSDMLGRQQRDGVVDGVRSSRDGDMATAGGRSGTWLSTAAPQPGHHQPILRASHRQSG